VLKVRSARDFDTPVVLPGRPVAVVGAMVFRRSSSTTLLNQSFRPLLSGEGCCAGLARRSAGAVVKLGVRVKTYRHRAHNNRHQPNIRWIDNLACHARRQRVYFTGRLSL